MKNDDQKLKKKLKDWIDRLEDQAMLQNLKNLKESTEGKDFWDELSDAEKEAINRGKADLQAGRSYTSEEVWKEIKQRRKSKRDEDN